MGPPGINVPSNYLLRVTRWRKTCEIDRKVILAWRHRRRMLYKCSTVLHWWINISAPRCPCVSARWYWGYTKNAMHDSWTLHCSHFICCTTNVRVGFEEQWLIPNIRCQKDSESMWDELHVTRQAASHPKFPGPRTSKITNVYCEKEK